MKYAMKRSNLMRNDNDKFKRRNKETEIEREKEREIIINQQGKENFSDAISLLFLHSPFSLKTEFFLSIVL